MNALIVAEKGRLEIVDIPQPVTGPYDALVRMEVCGICNSTDIKLIDGEMYWAPPFPFILGHESVGVVIERGKKVRNFKIGDRVTRPTAYFPGNTGKLNVANGGFAELGIVRDGRAMAADGDNSLIDDYHVNRQLVVPGHLTPLDASLSISLSETASTLNHLPAVKGKKILVAGAGVVGLSFALWVKLAGGLVIVLDRRRHSLEMAEKMGADEVVNSENLNFLDRIEEASLGKLDGIIEATGDVSLAETLLNVLKPDGFACAYGVPPKAISYSNRWIPAIVEEQKNYYRIADLVLQNLIKTEWFITNTWSFEQIVEAFNSVRKGIVLKGFIQFT